VRAGLISPRAHPSAVNYIKNVCDRCVPRGKPASAPFLFYQALCKLYTYFHGLISPPFLIVVESARHEVVHVEIAVRVWEPNEEGAGPISLAPMLASAIVVSCQWNYSQGRESNARGSAGKSRRPTLQVFHCRRHKESCIGPFERLGQPVSIISSRASLLFFSTCNFPNMLKTVWAEATKPSMTFTCTCPR